MYYCRVRAVRGGSPGHAVMRSAKARRGYYVIDAQVPFIHTSQGNKAIRNADERENTTDYDLEREREGGHLSEEEMPRGLLCTNIILRR